MTRTVNELTFGTCSERCYQNLGNPALLKMINLTQAGRALDCGCGAGDNAHVLASRGWEVIGITISPDERSKAAQHCSHVYVHDLECGIPEEVSGPFDLIIFSHVLEHLFNPSRVLRDAERVLAPGGSVAVALPNVLTWRIRLEFLAGRFEYQKGGIMDDTHVRFYTFESGKRLLEAHGFHVSEATADGSFPFRYLRRLMPRVARYLDHQACELRPGLFGWQLLYIATPK